MTFRRQETLPRSKAFLIAHGAAELPLHEFWQINSVEPDSSESFSVRGGGLIARGGILSMQLQLKFRKQRQLCHRHEAVHQAAFFAATRLGLRYQRWYR